MERKLKIGIIGFGRMGRKFFVQLQKNPKWEIRSICDLSEASRNAAKEMSPLSMIFDNEDNIFNDPEIDAVALCALADSRSCQIKKALIAGKHVMAEKPIASDSAKEWELVDLIEKSGLMVTVNIFNRNAWYHKVIVDFIREGEIGELGVIRVCHMTPGLIPGEGHQHEGPPFHDCGMHYVDVARWYANSDYATWHAQGLKMWDYKDPWWIQCHGTFENGVVFDITQGFIYGQLSKDQTHNSYVEAIGSLGVARMTHDFKTATVELRGVNRTEIITKPFNDKKIDVLCDVFADSILCGKNLGYPIARDSVIASDMAWKMLESALENKPPVIGTPEELERIRAHRQTLTNGYGLPVKDK